MTEYDYSPEAMEKFMANQQRIAKWVDNTEAHAHEFCAPDVPSPTSGHPGHSAHRPPTPHHKRAPKPIIPPALPFADPLVAPPYMFQSPPPSPLGAGYSAQQAMYPAQTQAYPAKAQAYPAGYSQQQGYSSEQVYSYPQQQQAYFPYAAPVYQPQYPYPAVQSPTYPSQPYVAAPMMYIPPRKGGRAVQVYYV
ncbi:hypothetical protein C8J56DRAFT_909451 [Mycena floridula]|nr:hypothetical protein C8J56DRAFT_909451 [Mycena floridula]